METNDICVKMWKNTNFWQIGGSGTKCSDHQTIKMELSTKFEASLSIDAFNSSDVIGKSF